MSIIREIECDWCCYYDTEDKFREATEEEMVGNESIYFGIICPTCGKLFEYDSDPKGAWENIKKELAEEDPIAQNVLVVEFYSFSRGKKKKKRKFPRRVVLIKVKPSEKWHFWSGKDCSLPWDEWATEIIGNQSKEEVEDYDCYIIFPGDYLRKRVEELLVEGKF